VGFRGWLATKTLDGTPVCNKYKPGQRTFILSAELGTSPSNFAVKFSQNLFRTLGVRQNTQQKTE